MKTSPRGIALITEREGGAQLKAYKDVVGFWTIGVGHRMGENDPMVISQATSDAYLAADLARFEAAVELHVKVPLVQFEFDALVSTFFNEGEAFGTSTAVNRLNLGNRRGAVRAWSWWNNAGGKYVQGLADRRADEIYQFLGGV